MRFVVLSFLFMGWSFYELSGGADFQPRGVRPAPQQIVAQKTEPAAEPVVQKAAALDLAGKTVLKPRKPKPAIAPAPEPEREEMVARLAQTGNGFNLFPTEATEGLTLTSLGQGAAGLTSRPSAADQTVQPAPEFVAPKPDIREVAGTRVNMRNGPGTTYSVVKRLNIGHEVEILSDPGNGWLRLRVLPEQQIGWISASLISKRSN